MSKLTKEQMLEMVRVNIKKMEDKSFNVFFYVSKIHFKSN